MTWIHPVQKWLTSTNDAKRVAEMKRKRDYEESSGNVFADLGFSNSKQELLKAKLTVEIYKLAPLARPGMTAQAFQQPASERIPSAPRP